MRINPRRGGTFGEASPSRRSAGPAAAGAGLKIFKMYPDGSRARSASESDAHALALGLGSRDGGAPGGDPRGGGGALPDRGERVRSAAGVSGGRREEEEGGAGAAVRAGGAGDGGGGHRGMGMNAVGAPPGARVGAARERENTLLSLGRAAAHAAVAFVEFDVQVRTCSWPGLVFRACLALGLELERTTALRICDARLVPGRWKVVRCGRSKMRAAGPSSSQ